jgi:hypothetical protein
VVCGDERRPTERDKADADNLAVQSERLQRYVVRGNGCEPCSEGIHAGDTEAVGVKREPYTHILLRKHLQELGLCWQEEVRFHPICRWRWDFTLLTRDRKPMNVAIEIQGAIWAGRKGGHTGGLGMQRDMDKRNAGAVLGWHVLTFSSADVLRGRAKAFIKEHLCD